MNGERISNNVMKGFFQLVASVPHRHPPSLTVILRAASHETLLPHVGHVAEELPHQLLADLGADGEPARGLEAVLVGDDLRAGDNIECDIE